MQPRSANDCHDESMNGVPVPSATPPSVSAGKAEWRRWVRAGRRLTPDPAAASRIASAVLTDPHVEAALSSRPEAPVLAYVSTAGEPPTGELRVRLRAQGRQVVLPWALPDRQLRWLADDGTAQAWGLPGVGAPPPEAATLSTEEILSKDPAVVLVPALAATSDGKRLGQGGGYYDTLLAALPRLDAGGPLRVALVWRRELVTELPVDLHDEVVDIVIAD